MRLFRMTNSQGELVMIAPPHTFLHFHLLLPAEVRHLERLRSSEKWAVEVVVADRPDLAQEFQFEALPLEIPQAQGARVTAGLEDTCVCGAGERLPHQFPCPLAPSGEL